MNAPQMIKRLLIKRLNLPESTNISEIRIIRKGAELPNYRSLSNMAKTVHLQWCFREASSAIGFHTLDMRPPPVLKQILGEINLGLQRGINPKLAMDGTGGTYLLSDSKGRYVGIFKPQDEEAFTPNNPRCYEGQMGQRGFRSGVLSGEGASREVAAFLIDAQHGGQAGVPQTIKVEGRHSAFCHKTLIQGSGIKGLLLGPNQTFWKEGSLQEYVDAEDTCEDYDPRVFAISDAHYIGILDIVIMNMDRNDGNILVTGRIPSDPDKDIAPNGKISKFKLIPIDHGFILPDTLDIGDVDLVWYRWPQSYIPFSNSELRHIFSFDGDKDAQRLARKLEIRAECLRTMRVTTRLLQLGAKMHLNLHQIASLMVRVDDFEKPSMLEKAVQTALAQAYTAVSASAYVKQNRLSCGAEVIDLHLSKSTEQPQEMENLQWRPNSKFSKNDDTTSSLTSDTDTTLCDQDFDSHKSASSFPYSEKKTNQKTTGLSNSVQDVTPKISKQGSTSLKKHNENSENTLKPVTSNNSRKKRSTALLRRKTAHRLSTPMNSAWTLIDSHKRPIQIDWNNPLFERTFLECFELIIKRDIAEAHPCWKSYPFYGHDLLTS